MKITMLKKVFLTGVTVGIASLAVGCYDAPFAPVAVPDATFIRPAPPVSHELEEAELRKLQKAEPEDYKVGPGDSFNIFVEGEASDKTRTVVVQPDGTICLYPVGTIKVIGLTLPQVNAILNEKYAAFVKDTIVMLEPVQLRSYQFTIAGSVANPQVYPFIYGNFRLSDAVGEAGGFATLGEAGNKVSLADLDHAYITRNGRMLPVDFKKALIDGDKLHNIPVLDGDYIYIPSLMNGQITTLGEIGQGTMAYRPNLTLLQVVAEKGIKETYSREIKIIRGGMNSPVVFTVNVHEMMRGHIKDFEIKPRDVIFVPRDAPTQLSYYIRTISPILSFINMCAGPFGSPATVIYGQIQ